MNRTFLAISGLNDSLAAVDNEFKDFLGGLAFKKAHGVSTYSPLDAVEGFEQRGLQQVREVSSKEMMKDGDALQKLLANMLAHCKPGQLSDEDLEQLSGINGREVAAAL